MEEGGQRWWPVGTGSINSINQTMQSAQVGGLGAGAWWRGVVDMIVDRGHLQESRTYCVWRGQAEGPWGVQGNGKIWDMQGWVYGNTRDRNSCLEGLGSSNLGTG